MLSLLLAAAIAPGVPPSLLNHLQTGVNITRWFCYLANEDRPTHFRNYLTDADFLAFKRLKLKFVRLCIAPEVIYQDGHVNQETLPYLDSAVKRLTAAGLVVLWDLHDNGGLHLDQLDHDDAGFVSFWSEVARHYKGRFENRLVFELLNEPQFNPDPKNPRKGPDAWYALERQSIDAIRNQDPSRTVMATGTEWSSIDMFVKMPPMPEGNLIYTFHCYDPFFFTHQGAEWVGEWPGNLKRVPFPSSPEAVAAILPLNDRKYWNSLENYGKAHYDAAYLKDRLAGPMAWGREHHVPVVLGEFGAYPKISEPAARARWFEAMRAAIDADQVPNSIWGYDDAMGLGRRLDPDGTLWLDPVTLESFFQK